MREGRLARRDFLCKMVSRGWVLGMVHNENIFMCKDLIALTLTLSFQTITKR